MATYQELNQYFKEKNGCELQRATLTRWIKEKRFEAIKQPNGRYDYNLQTFKQLLEDEDYQKKSRAAKEKPEDYIGKQCGQLQIISIVPKEERKEKDYLGTLMYCKCLNCNREDYIQVRFAYLTSNGNYTQLTCGCKRKEKAFLAAARDGITEEFISKYSNDFDTFLFIHKMLTHTTDKYYTNCPIKEYEQAIEYFYNNNQFQKVYVFWKHQPKNNTFYDWAKPSIDHIVPKSKGGTHHISNLQVLTVFENLSKRDMTQEEWNNFKKETETASNYFIENIINL